MKKLFILMLPLLFSGCSANRSHQPDDQYKQIKQKINKTTEFEFNEEIHNFGSLQAGEIVVFSFEFKNTGNENLTIESVEADCGCVKEKFSDEPVKPGKSGIIEIEFDSSGLFGRQFKTIEIHANTKKPKQLAIFAEIQNNEVEIKY